LAAGERMSADGSCSQRHTIANDDYGTEPVKSDGPSRKVGPCAKCKRNRRLKKCGRCSNYFCEEAKR
jgi:hypothetical protein